MVFIITGTAESDTSTVGRLLADDLGWEFVDGGNLHPPDLDAPNRNAFPANPDLSFRIETLSAAISCWIYKWQDVVVSCPALTETDRRQLSQISSLVKIVCLEASHAAGGSPWLDRKRPYHVVGCQFPDGGRAKREPGQEVLTVDPSRQVKEIIREMVSSPK
jgi:gluconate kinase